MATYPTFMQVVKTSYNKDGEDKQVFLGTVFGLLTRIEEKMAGDSLIIQGSLPINKRGKTINSVMGSSFPENDDAAIWAKVQFWGKTGERFKKYHSTVGGNIRLIISGSWKIQTYNSGNGDVSQLVINVDNFQPVNGVNESDEPKQDTQKKNNGSYKKDNKPSSNENPVPSSDFNESDIPDNEFDPYGLGSFGFNVEEDDGDDVPF